MAEPVRIVIEVDDRGSPVITQFSQNAVTQLGNVNKATQTFTAQAEKSASIFEASFLRAAQVSLVFRTVNEVFTSIVNAAQFAANSVLDFDHALREVATISVETRERFNDIRREIIGLDAGLGTTTQIAQGLYETFSSGIAVNRSVSDALQFTAEAAKLARAGLTSTEVATRTLSASLNAYGQGLESATEFSDILFGAVELGQFRFEELANSIGVVLPTARVLGISFGDVAAAMAVLSQAGFSAARGGTALNSALQQMIINADAFRATGLDLQVILSQQGLLGALNAVRDATGGNSEAIASLFRDARGLRGVLSLLSQDSDRVAQSFELITNRAGATQDAFNQIKLSGREAIADLIGEFDRFFQRLAGNQAVPRFVATLRGFGQVVREFGESVDQSTVLDKFRSSVNLVIGSLEFFQGTATKAFGEIVQGLAHAGASTQFFGTEFFETYREAGATLSDFGASQQDWGRQAAQIFTDVVFRGKTLEEALGEIAKAQEVVTQSSPTPSINFLDRAFQEGTAQALQYRKGLLDIGDASEDTSKKNNSLQLSIDLTNRQIADSSGNINTLVANLLEVSRTSSDFDTQLNKLTETVVSTGTRVKGLSQDDFADLVRQFSFASRQALEITQRLTDLGATGQIIQGGVSALTDSFVNLAAEQGVSRQTLELYLNSLQDAQVRSASLGKILQLTGVDVQNLTTDIASLISRNKGLKAELVETEVAFNSLTGRTLSAFVTQAAKTIDAIDRLKESGNFDQTFIIESVDAAINQFRKFGLEVPASLIKAREEAVKLPPTIREIQESVNGISLDKFLQDAQVTFRQIEVGFESGAASNKVFAERIDSLIEKFVKLGLEAPEAYIKLRQSINQADASTRDLETSLTRLGILSTEQVGRFAVNAVADFNNTLRSGTVDAGFLLDKFDSFTKQVREQFGGQLPPILENVRQSILAQANAFGTVEGAASRLSVSLERDIVEALNRDVIAFQRLSSSGRASVVELAAAAHTVVDSYTKAGIEAPKELLNALDRLRDKARDTTSEINETLEDVATRLGVTLSRNVLRTAEETISGVRNLLSSGERNFGELAQVVQRTIQEIITSGQRVPPAYEALFQELVRRAQAAGLKIEDALDLSGLANRTKAEFEKIGEALDNVRIEQRFRTGLAGVSEELSRIQMNLRNLPSSFGVGVVGLVEHQRELYAGITQDLRQSLIDAFLPALDQARSLAEETGKVILPPGLQSAAAQLGIDFNRIRQELEQIARGLSDASGEAERTATHIELVAKSISGVAASRLQPVVDEFRLFTNVVANSRPTVEEVEEALDSLGITTQESLQRAAVSSGLSLQKILQDGLVARDTLLQQWRSWTTQVSQAFFQVEDVGTATIQDLARIWGDVPPQLAQAFLEFQRIANEVNGRIAAGFYTVQNIGDGLGDIIDQVGSSLRNLITTHVQLGIVLRGNANDVSNLSSRYSQLTSSVLNLAAAVGGIHGTASFEDLFGVDRPPSEFFQRGSAGTTRGGSLPQFAAGTIFAAPGQVVRLEAGEAVLPRQEAARYRAGTQTQTTPTMSSGVSFWTAFRPDVNRSAQESSGFTFVPGMGYTPSFGLANSFGRLSPDIQTAVQRNVVPAVQDAIRRQVFTRGLRSVTVEQRGVPTT